MAVEFYSVRDKEKSKLLFSLESSDFELLSIPFKKLREKSGVVIDEYKDGILSYTHLELIIHYISEIIEKKEKNYIFDKSYHKLKYLIKKFEKVQKTDLTYIGD